MNADSIIKDIVTEIKSTLEEYVDGNELLFQSNLYLRCSRPLNPSSQESIGFHRESFYGSNMEHSINVWTPVKGVTKENTLLYIPRSQEIPDEKITTQGNEDEYTSKYSDGHKLGFLYKPKEIISGVDLDSKQPLLLDEFNSAIFSGNLIHGAAKNYAARIRYSVDFRIIQKKHYSKQNKAFHFASKKPYFVSLNEI